MNSLSVGHDLDLSTAEEASPVEVDDQELAKGLTQWAKFDTGSFMPTSSTAKRIPPGVYTIKVQPGSVYFRSKKILTDNLLTLPDLKSDEIITEIKKFWTLKDKFRQYGFSYKRGAILYGKPGTGKTTTLNLVMRDTVAMGGVVVMGHINFPYLPQMLHAFREIHPERPLVVVFEDVDEIARRHENQLLGLLDGEDNIDNVFFLATTNYLDHMDSRLTNRPSRFDRIIEIATPSQEARLMYLRSRNLEINDSELQRWAEMTDGLCIAQLKELIVSVLCLGHGFEDTLERLKHLPESADPVSKKVKFRSKTTLDDLLGMGMTKGSRE